MWWPGCYLWTWLSHLHGWWRRWWQQQDFAHKQSVLLCTHCHCYAPTLTIDCIKTVSHTALQKPNQNMNSYCTHKCISKMSQSAYVLVKCPTFSISVGFRFKRTNLKSWLFFLFQRSSICDVAHCFLLIESSMWAFQLLPCWFSEARIDHI